MPKRPPRLRPLLLAAGLLPAAALAGELGVRAYDSYTGGSLSRPPCPAAAAVPCPLARHALPAFGAVSAADPATGVLQSSPVNSLGVRGGPVAVPKPAGTVRVLILGDEAALAAHLPAEFTFAGLLTPPLAASAAAKTPGTRTEVLNAAVPGDCPLLSVLRLRTLAAVRPDLILLCVRPSDLREDARYRRDLLLDDAGRPLACPHPSFTKPGGRDAGAPWWRQSLAVRALGRRAARCAAPGASPGPADLGPPGEMAAEQALAPLADLARVAAGLGVPGVVVCLPERPEPGFAADARAAARVVAAARASGLPVFDAVADFAAGPDPASLVHPGGALTRAGQQRLAAGVAGFLVPPAAGPGG